MSDVESGMSAGEQPVSNPASTPAPSSSQTAAQEEKLFRQSEVNDIVKRAKYGAVEDYKRVAAERPDYVKQKEADSYQTPPPSYLSPDDVRRMAAEESQRLRDEWVQSARQQAMEQDAQKIVSEFFNKLAPGFEKYQDYKEVTGDVNYGKFPNVVQLLNSHIDNTSDVMYALAKDRIKMANLEFLSQHSPEDAIKAVKQLSQSMKDNELAAKTRFPKEPLSQMRPSNAGTDQGEPSVKDYRAKYRI
jgi:hypothetical protein